MNTGIKLDLGDSRRHRRSLLLKTKRSEVLTLKNFRGNAFIDLGPFLEREFVDLALVRFETTTGGIRLTFSVLWLAGGKPTKLEPPHYFGVLKFQNFLREFEFYPGIKNVIICHVLRATRGVKRPGPKNTISDPAWPTREKMEFEVDSGLI
jgi:hypothetical protein